jgi:hypothetical protein
MDEMDQFHEMHNLPKLAWEEIDNLSPTYIEELELINNNCPKDIKNKSIWVTGEFYQLNKKLYHFSIISFKHKSRENTS